MTLLSKPSFPLLFLLAITTVVAPHASGQSPTILWSFDTRDASYGQTAAGDIDGDSRLELVFGCFRNDSCVYALNAEDGSLLWKYNTNVSGGDGCNDVAPIIVDVDSDDRLEVVVPSSCNPTTYCFDGATGAVKWSTATRGSDSPPTAADIDSDGLLEILHGEFGGWVICLNAEDGSVAWEIAVDTNSWIQTAPTILDADGDGALDFVVATWNLTAGAPNAVYAFRSLDRSLLWSRSVQDVVYHGTAVADLDSDGRPELAIGDYSGTITVMNAEDGSVMWSVPSAGAGHYVGGPVTIGDVDGDGSCELIYVSWYKVVALKRDGALLWNYSIPGYGTAFRGAILADVTGDALVDVVLGTSNGLLIGLNGTRGDELWRVDLATHRGDSLFALDHAPVIADLDGDGGLDAFIVGGYTDYPDVSQNYGRAYAVSIGQGTGPEWLMFQQNARRTNSLCPDEVSGAAYDTRIPQRTDVVGYNRGRLRILAGENGRVCVYSVGGELVLDTPVRSGINDIDASGLLAGTYIVRVWSNDGRMTGQAVQMILPDHRESVGDGASSARRTPPTSLPQRQSPRR